MSKTFLPGVTRTTTELYRECLKLAGYVGGKTGCTTPLQKNIRKQFKLHMHEKNPEKIEQYRNDAIRAISNYFVFAELKRTDPRFQGPSYEEQEKAYEEKQRKKKEEHDRKILFLRQQEEWRKMNPSADTPNSEIPEK